MDAENEDQYFIYENRLASFHGPQPVARRRPSTAAGSRAPKTLTWPHQTPTPEQLARAGFYFNPSPSNPDNVSCFLCRKDMDGWEDDDDPLQEHLKHAGSCGWAVCAAIELELGDASTDDPRQPYLLEARKATFAGRWPYEKKKGWKCKTKQLAEAGWKYTPTLESDDHTTCTYCQLALDGWEAGDKPLDEHKRRSPNCPFFALINQNPPPKRTRGKNARIARLSRMSTVSIISIASDAPSVADPDDSMMTATTTMTQNTRKAGAGRSRKATTTTTAKGRKTRAKKEGSIDAVEIFTDPVQSPPAQPAMQVALPEAAAPRAKPTRGKKRDSDEMEAADADAAAAAPTPPRKKRATRVGNSQPTAVEPAATDYAMFDPVPPEIDEAVIDEELRTLEREMAMDNDVPTMPEQEPEPEQQPQQELVVPKKGGRQTGTGAARKVSKQTTRRGKQSAVAAPAPPVAEPEPENMQVEEAEEETQPAPEPVQPVKRTKAKTTTTGKAKTKKGSVPEPPQQQDDDGEEPDELHEHSMISIISISSTDTVEAPPPKRGRGRPSKKSIEARRSQEQAAAVAAAVPAAPQTKAKKGKTLSAAPQAEEEAAPAKAPQKKKQKSLPPKKEEEEEGLEDQENQVQQPLAEVPFASTPNVSRFTPVQHQQTPLSPSLSPQSSDAENQPPSSKASGAKKAAAPAPAPASMVTAGKRVALAPVQTVSTPVRATATAVSPSKRQNNVLGGLRSGVAWSATDVDRIFAWHGKEGTETGSSLVAQLVRPGTELSTPEKAMTVEEFIYHNAGVAERLLKDECEAMVTAFEREGSRAMQVLESLEVEE